MFNRKAVSSFCTKLRHVYRVGPRPSSDITGVTTLCRVLITLNYDRREALWCPLTISRPIRQVASQRHEYQRPQWLQTQCIARRKKHENEAEAAVQVKKDAIETELLAWQLRTAPYRQQPRQSEASGTGAAAAARSQPLVDAEDNAPHVIIPVPGDNPSNGSKTPSLKPEYPLPFHAVLCPNLVQTDVGLTLLL
ncbi:hypothetical protein NXY56_007493 [Leishmania guyanensis]